MRARQGPRGLGASQPHHREAEELAERRPNAESIQSRAIARHEGANCGERILREPPSAGHSQQVDSLGQHTPQQPRPMQLTASPGALGSLDIYTPTRPRTPHTREEKV